MASRTGLAITAAVLIGVAAQAAPAQIPPNTRITASMPPGGGHLLTAERLDAPARAPEASSSAPSLTLTKAVDRHEVPVGIEVTYVFSVTNDGPGDASNVLVTDTDLVGAVLDGRLEFMTQDFVTIPSGAALAVLYTFISSQDPSFSRAFVDLLAAGETFSWKLVFRAGGPVGASVTNQASAQVDCSQGASEPCPNEVVAMSDDPDTTSPDDPTVILIVSPLFAPVVGPLVLGLSAAGMLFFGVRRLRSRLRAHR